MGLDMFLYKKKFYYEGEMERLKGDIKAVKEKMPELVDVVFKHSADIVNDLCEDDSRVESIEKLAIQWRKSNAIHRWFIEHTGDEWDDESEREVSVDDLKRLLEVCEKVIEGTKMKPGEIHMGTVCSEGKVTEKYEPGEVIANPELADELLPTQEGFFFGSTDYDQYYLNDVKYTAEKIKEILKNADEKDWTETFIYRASW